MALQNSGTIKASDINIELGRSASALLSLGGPEARGLADIETGPVRMSDFYGKSDILEVTYVNTQNRTGASIYQLMGSPTEPGRYYFINRATISGVRGYYEIQVVSDTELVFKNYPPQPALRTGVFPTGCELIIVNEGYILGAGGRGSVYEFGAMVTPNPTEVLINGGPGGTALYLDMDCTLDNSKGYIRGGGGGGGAAYQGSFKYTNSATGGPGAGSLSGMRYNSVVGTADMVLTRQSTEATASAGGLGGIIDTSKNNYSPTNIMRGGTGGTPGNNGEPGSMTPAWGTPSNGTTTYTGSGGAGGKGIVKRGHALTITGGNSTSRIVGGIA